MKQPGLELREPPMVAPTPRVKWAVTAKKCTRRPRVSGNTYMRVIHGPKGSPHCRVSDTKEEGR
jgi:hypothetical protein